MEIPEPTETGTAVPDMASGPVVSNGEKDIYAVASAFDDGRSSSLSDIDESLDHDQLDEFSPKMEKPPTEIDSEAETERIEDSPGHVPTRKNIVLSVTGGGYENSPSKLAQSTTYEDIGDEDEPEPDDSPSKPPRSSKDNDADADAAEEATPSLYDHGDRIPTPVELAGKKRKRLGSVDDTTTELGEDEPVRKRRGSIKSELAAEDAADDTPLSPEDAHKEIEDTPVVEDAQETEPPSAPMTRTRRGKKGKRKGRKAKDADDDTDRGLDDGGERDSNGPGDDNVDEEGVDGADDAEDVASKNEEEAARKTAAMNWLATLEKEFATLRDRVYDERIAKLNRELSQLEGPNPTHPEFLRQLDCVQKYRDKKMVHEHKLFEYKLKSLFTKSLAERAQIHSTYYQRVRDVRESHLENVGALAYKIQHGRYQADDTVPRYTIPFPTRRSVQIAQQNAYNKEVSILAGVRKYVGMPAAPPALAARQAEIEEDLEKMGIPTHTKAHSLSQPGYARPAMSAVHGTRMGAEEDFFERTPWANAQHPLHQHYQEMQQGGAIEHRVSSFTTPMAQQRAVDIHAPNGSASTIPEHPSAPNSSAANTPHGTEQDSSNRQPHLNSGRVRDAFYAQEFEGDHRTGFRSMSSSPLDVRKSVTNQPTSSRPRNPSGRQSPTAPAQPDPRSDGGSARNAAYSGPTPSRFSLFGSPAKREPSPMGPLHQSAGITAGGAGSSRMTAR